MKKIMITGGDGFIGLQLVKEFLSKKYIVYTLSNNIMIRLSKNHHHIVHDIQVPIKEKSIYNDIEFLIHTAAFIPTNMNDQSLAKKCLLVNSIGTLNLLNFAKNIGVKHFIYLTSANSYKFTSKTVTEDYCLDPSSRATFYLSSKVVGEFYLNSYSRKNYFKTTVFRLSTVYGIHNNDLINKAVKKIFNKEIFEIYNKDYKTDFIYDKDIINHISESVEKSIFGTYNLSSGESYNLLKVIRLVSKLCGNKDDSLIKISNLLNDKGFSSISNKKTLNRFKIKITKLKFGISQIIKQYKKNKE